MATVAPDLRDRLEAFLRYVDRATATLAATVADATDEDLIFLLSASLLWKDEVETDAVVLAAAWRATWTRWPDGAALSRWLEALERVLAPERPALQAAIVMVLLERVCRALLATGTTGTPRPFRNLKYGLNSSSSR